MATNRRLALLVAAALLGAGCDSRKPQASGHDAAADRPVTGTGGAAQGTGGTGGILSTGGVGTGGLRTGDGGSTGGFGGTLGGTGGGKGGSGAGGSLSTGGVGAGGVHTGTGGAGTGGVLTGTGGAGTGGTIARGSGGTIGRGGTSGTSSGGTTSQSGTGGINGTGGANPPGTGGTGSGGTGGAGTGPTCAGEVCASDERCCGPSDCGHCVNLLSGAGCELMCGASGCGPTNAPCQPGEICLNVHVSMGPRETVTTKCVANPCGTQPLACACAGTVCQDANPATQCSQAQSDALVCIGGGVCASPDTPIATPTGNRPIAELLLGDLVYSEHDGAMAAVPLIQVVRRPVQGHLVVHVVTANGATLDISAPHPTADGRRFADLGVGDLLDGERILSREIVAYPHPYTYDILPASSTGTYLANGLLIGSTLGNHQRPTHAP